MSFDPRQSLLAAYERAPQEVLPLMLHGLQTGYLDPGPMPGSQNTLFEDLWEKLSPEFKAGRARNASDLARIRMGCMVGQSPKAWIEATGPQAWLEGSPSIALDALACMANYQKDLKARKNQTSTAQREAPGRWIEEMMNALPQLIQVAEDQRAEVLQQAVMLNSHTAIERFLDEKALLKKGHEGDQLRRALKNASNLWPKLLDMGIAEQPVGDLPFWLSVLETAGENGTASPTVMGIEAWAFEHQRWSALEPDTRKRAEAWQQKTMPIRLTAARTPTPHLLMWLANTPPEWHTVEGLASLPPEKAQALRLLSHQHHHLWEVPAHLGREGWVESVAAHPALGHLARQTPGGDIAVRGAMLALLQSPDKKHLQAAIQALHERDPSPPLPGLWRQAWGHNHIATLNWQEFFKLLHQPKSAGVLSAWKGDPIIEATHLREAFLTLFPKTRKFDGATLLRKVYLFEQFQSPLYSSLAAQWGGLLGDNKKAPPMDLPAWEALVKNDPEIGAAVTTTAKLKTRDLASLGAFHRALQLSQNLPDSVATPPSAPRF